MNFNRWDDILGYSGSCRSEDYVPNKLYKLCHVYKSPRAWKLFLIIPIFEISLDNLFLNIPVSFWISQGAYLCAAKQIFPDSCSQEILSVLWGAMLTIWEFGIWNINSPRFIQKKEWSSNYTKVSIRWRKSTLNFKEFCHHNWLRNNLG